jgi:hypothetical protein
MTALTVYSSQTLAAAGPFPEWQGTAGPNTRSVIILNQSSFAFIFTPSPGTAIPILPFTQYSAPVQPGMQYRINPNPNISPVPAIPGMSVTIEERSVIVAAGSSIALAITPTPLSYFPLILDGLVAATKAANGTIIAPVNLAYRRFLGYVLTNDSNGAVYRVYIQGTAVAGQAPPIGGRVIEPLVTARALSTTPLELVLPGNGRLTAVDTINDPTTSNIVISSDPASDVWGVLWFGAN